MHCSHLGDFCMDQLPHGGACAALMEKKIPNTCPMPGEMGGLEIDIAINKSLRPVLQCVLKFQQK